MSEIGNFRDREHFCKLWCLKEQVHVSYGWTAWAAHRIDPISDVKQRLEVGKVQSIGPLPEGFSPYGLFGGCKRWKSAITWEESSLQADLTMGNLVGALTLQSDEAALVAELQLGTEDAFAWLIAHYHQPIYSLLARTVRNQADAADLTQEVFVKVFRGIGGFHGESSLRTWIYRIALREASNQRRWWMRHQQQEIPIEQEISDGDGGRPALLGDMLVDPAESPYDHALHEENRVRVEQALRQVPEPFRTTLILRDIEGFVYEEVAAMQGVNLGTVKSRLVRGRAYLKALLSRPVTGSQTEALAGMGMPLGEEAR